MPKAVDEHPDTEFHGGDAKGAEGAFQNKRYCGQIVVDRKHHGKTESACDHHARMRITAPHDLQKSVCDTAKEHFDAECGKFISAKAIPKEI